MKFLKVSLLALLVCFGASAADDDLQELEKAVSSKANQLVTAQSRLKSAEASLKSNNDALIRAKLPDEQKSARTYVAIAQSRVSEERIAVNTIQREVETLKTRIVAIQKNQTPELKLDPATQTSAAPAKPAAPKALHTLVMKDGRRIECVRFMEVDDQYAMQMPDKKIQNVKKDEVAEIISP